MTFKQVAFKLILTYQNTLNLYRSVKKFMADKKKIVILGGGYGGVNAAKKIYKALKRRKDIEISLIDKNPYHTLMTELHEVAGGRAEADSVMVSYKKIFGGTKIRLITDNIKTVDFEGKRLISGSNNYGYDYLVIGAGAEPDFYDVPGVRKFGFTLWSLEDAIKIRNHIEKMFRLASREANQEKRKEILTFVVAGAGFTGVEMTGELLEWRKALCLKNGIAESEVKIILVEALEVILSILPEKMQKKAFDYIIKKGGEIRLKSPITEAKECIIHIKNGEEIKAWTMIWTGGVQGCEFGANLDLAKGKSIKRECSYSFDTDTPIVKEEPYAEGGEYISGKLGRLLTNQYMQSVDYEDVYIVGDLLWYEEKGSILPQVVETALQTSDFAAHNIIASIINRKKKAIKPNYHGFMVSIGGKYGVAHVMNVSLTGFFAMAMKHFINVHYLFGIAGINASWDYLRHHFLDVKENRTIIGGHAAVKLRIYWILILRLFLGTMWVIEGTSKVLSGWLDPSHIYILSTSATSGASAAQPNNASSSVDSTTSGSAASSQGGTASQGAASSLQSQSIPPDAETSASQSGGSQALSATPRPLLSKPLGIYVWMENVFISKAPFVFQAAVVVSEILIGLALIGGLFTFLASLGSIALCIMFIISSLAGKEILWYIACAIVMLGGAGRGFGLDYWVIPWIKKWWNGTKLAKKTYFYIDEPSK